MKGKPALLWSSCRCSALFVVRSVLINHTTVMTKTAPRFAVIACSLFSIILSQTSATAGVVEYRFDSGKCSNGNTWVSVSCYVGGVFAWSDGVDCDGTKYSHRGCLRVQQLPADPTEGLIPTHTGSTEIGPWKSVIIRDDSGIPISIAGVSESGSYYSAECSSTGGTPGGNQYE